MRKKVAAVLCAIVCSLTACSSADTGGEVISDSNASEETVVEETYVTEVEKVYAYEDRMIAEWFNNSLSDFEEFDDLTNYQYYARALNLDKDYFISPEMWEVYYNDNINRNRDIDNKVIYLIRLNPYKLLEAYAQNNEVDVDELCSELGVNKAQLYYNWGYTYAWNNYIDDYADGVALYSEKENEIFGVYAQENRAAVMKTHMLTLDMNENIIEYSTDVSDYLKYLRRDYVKNYTKNTYCYSAYSDDEKAALNEVNGIGIRCVIPLVIPNAYEISIEIDEIESESDLGVTPMLNYSPYAYGCTSSDIVDINDIISQLYEEED